jgi:hypothetical protein
MAFLSGKLELAERPEQFLLDLGSHQCDKKVALCQADLATVPVVG